MPGYSKTPLVRKLGLKEGHRAYFIEPPEEYFDWLGPSPEYSQPEKPPFDFVHLFTNRLTVLEDSLASLRNQIYPNGMIWVSWYKKASGLRSEITEDLIRDTCLPLGLVDVKVCAVSEQWSGLKLVIRKELR